MRHRFHLTSPHPIAVGPLMQFLAARAIPGVEKISPTSYRRTVSAGSHAGTLTVQVGDGGSFDIETTGIAPRDRAPMVDRIRHLFDLGAAQPEIDSHLRTSPVLAPLVSRVPGLRVPGSFDPFETGVRAILGQQVSVAGASTLTGRLVQRLGRRLPETPDRLTHLFPSAEALAAADLSGLGVPAQRRTALTAFAAAIANGSLRLDGSQPSAVARERLLALPGIGPWTADYIRMRVLHDGDAFPSGDLGLEKAAASLDAGDDLERLAAPWRPWRAYGAFHLWESLRSA